MLLTVDQQNFATLKNVINDSMQDGIICEFIFQYSIDIVEAMKNNALKVEIKINEPKSKSSIKTSFYDANGNLDNSNVINQILKSKLSTITETINNNFKQIVTYSDNTTRANNEKISSMSIFRDDNRGTLVATNTNFEKKDNKIEKKSIINHSVIPSWIENYQKSSNKTNSELMKLLVSNNVDPSIIATLSDRSINSYSLVNGFNKTEIIQETIDSIETKLLNQFIKTQTQQSDTNPIKFSKINNNTKQIYTTVKFFIKNNILSSKLNVEFGLIRSKQGKIESISRSLNVKSHIDNFHFPIKPPTLGVYYTNESNIAIINITQTDDIATSVEVYKKVLSPTFIDNNMTYQKLGEYKLLPKQTFFLKENRTESAIQIYRVISKYGNKICDDYTNVIIPPKIKHSTINKNATLSCKQISSGVVLELRNLSDDAISVQFLSKNIIAKTDYKVVNNQTYYIGKNSIISIIDNNVKVNKLYQYIAKITYQNGSIVESNPASIECIKIEENKIDTKVSTPQILLNQENIDVQFVVESKPTDTDTNNILNFLTTVDKNQYYNDEFGKQKNDLGKILSYQIIRMDYESGIREDFGVYTGVYDKSTGVIKFKFSDVLNRKNLNIAPLLEKKKYRYEIYSLSLDPEVILDIEKTKIDLKTKKQYKFKPRKFFHPFVYKTSTIYNTNNVDEKSDSKKLFSTKSNLAHGLTGDPIMIDVSIDAELTGISDLFAIKFDKYTNQISWKITGDKNNVDFFLIFKNEKSQKTLIGKTHAISDNNQIIYNHRLSKKDIGVYSYSVIPILQTYTVGSEIKSNEINIQFISEDI